MRLSQPLLLKFLESDLSINISGVDGDTPLFSSGIVDSFSLITLMTYIEQEERIRIHPGDVSLSNFDTIGRILDYISKQEAAAR